MLKPVGMDLQIQKRFPANLRDGGHIDNSLFVPMCRIQWNQYVFMTKGKLDDEYC